MWFTWMLAMQLWSVREDAPDPWRTEESKEASQPVPRVPHEPRALVA